MDTRLGIEDVRASLARMTGDEKHEESSTSTLDALWVLYDRVLRVDPADPTDPDRDRFILSKGHGPAAFYAVLAAKGFFPEDELDGFLSWGSRLGSHPDRRSGAGRRGLDGLARPRAAARGRRRARVARQEAGPTVASWCCAGTPS